VIIEALAQRGATIKAYDPVAMVEAARVMRGIDGLAFVPDQASALAGSDALLIVTEWRQFKSPDFDAIRTALKQPVVIDGRNLYDPRLMRAHGIEYDGIGRKAALTEAAEEAVSA
jgi:UDPglucose 6-dehydrogenase